MKATPAAAAITAPRKTGRLISVTQAGSFEKNLVTFSDDLSGDGHLAFQRDIYDNKPASFSIDLDRAASVLDFEPAPSFRALLHHHSADRHLRRRIAGADRQDGGRLAFWCFAQNRSLLSMTAKATQDQPQGQQK